MAAGLAERGVTKGDRVALLSRNSADFAAIAWGAARLGAILVPINFMLTADEVGFILGNSEPVAMLTQPEFVATADAAIDASGLEIGTRVVTGDARGGWTPFADLVATDATGWEPPLVADDDPIRLMYTSGTESRPKGALLTSRALQAEWDRRAIPVPLKALDSPYREITRPVVEYVKSIRSGNPRDLVVVYIPQYVLGHWWEQALHNQSALRLRSRLIFTPGVMVSSVPWQLASSAGAEERMDGPVAGDVRRGGS